MESVPTAKLVLEFSAYDMAFRSSNCRYNKCFFHDSNRVNAILDAVEREILPYLSRTLALYIADEIETNPQSIDTINRIVANIRSRDSLKNLKLWVNFDNVHQSWSGTPLVLPEDIDIVSLTPSYGSRCYDVCDSDRYRVLLTAVKQHNITHQRKMALMIMSDGWHRSADHISGSLTEVGKVHLDKIGKSFDGIKRYAEGLGIQVLGESVFSYSEPSYSVQQSSQIIKDAWRREGVRLISGQSSVNTGDNQNNQNNQNTNTCVPVLNK